VCHSIYDLSSVSAQNKHESGPLISFLWLVAPGAPDAGSDLKSAGPANPLLPVLLLLLLFLSLLPVLLMSLHDLLDYRRVVQSGYVAKITSRLHGNLPEDPPHDLPGASLRQPLHHLTGERKAEL